jgi:hypothetical protein
MECPNHRSRASLGNENYQLPQIEWQDTQQDFNRISINLRARTDLERFEKKRSIL